MKALTPTPSVPSQENDLILTLDAFVRSIGIKRTTPHALFLGAGASMTSGMPSAETCIWEWKRSLFLTNNPGMEAQFAELSLPSVRKRIQQWLDKQAIYPKEGTSDEYGFYIRQCFPIADDRRAFFEEKTRLAQPHIGYRLMCHLARTDLIRSVWTTNFDALPARAAASCNLTPFEVGIDSQPRVQRPTGKNILMCVAMHGDYRYDALKNTREELQKQEEVLREALIQEAKQTPLIVCGYSGRDKTVMEAFHTAYTQPGTGTLYWCGYGDGDIPELVLNLLNTARAHGRQAYYVPALGFDDLMTRLALHCLEGDARETAKKDMAAMTAPNLLERQPFQIGEYRANTLIKSNAFQIDCPGEVFSFELNKWPTEKVWSSLREMAAPHGIVVVPFKNNVLALGTIEGIKSAFGDNIKGSIGRAPVIPDDFRHEDGAVVRLMREALLRSMAANAAIATDYHSEIWLKTSMKKEKKEGQWYNIHESAVLFLRRVGGVQYLILKPSLKVLKSDGTPAPREVAEPLKIAILGYQHNKPFNIAVNKWRELLFPKGESTATFEFPIGVASNFKFRVRRSPVFSQIGLPHGGSSRSAPDSLKSLIKYKGVQLDEPSLVFCDKRGTGKASDTHQVRGLVNNRPFDYSLTLKGLAPSLRIGVICAQSETARLQGYLPKANQFHQPADSERDYLFDYPGFQQAYGLPIDLPQPGGPGWVSCAEPSGEDARTGSLSVAQQITKAIDTLHSSYAPHVVVIFFPERWEKLRGYKDENERFDVHDFVKAYAVQRGIATQFLTESTLSDNQQCRVWWWLSLALYVKGMRTPWVLDGLDDDTAYVGLGFSMDHNAAKGAQVVLGCSHIYSTRGEGMQYRLSKVENPIIRQGNPFMSKDDARRTGETIRQLFFESRTKLPRRVVLHKQTPFLKDEREGLLDGLSGISAIDMLEIQQDHALRYVASMMDRDGKIDEDNFPVRRGTVMKLDDFTALLWVHGATAAANNPNWKYFQGKRRIPTPLTLRRHAGDTPLAQLGTEILGLSKMNWNTFDHYSKMPATLRSSGEIARIGALLERFGSVSYDYRLFI